MSKEPTFKNINKSIPSNGRETRSTTTAPLKIGNATIRYLSGPYCYFLLVPKYNSKEVQHFKNSGIDLPIILIFGDNHQLIKQGVTCDLPFTLNDIVEIKDDPVRYGIIRGISNKNPYSTNNSVMRKRIIENNETSEIYHQEFIPIYHVQIIDKDQATNRPERIKKTANMEEIEATRMKEIRPRPLGGRCFNELGCYKIWEDSFLQLIDQLSKQIKFPIDFVLEAGHTRGNIELIKRQRDYKMIPPILQIVEENRPCMAKNRKDDSIPYIRKGVDEIKEFYLGACRTGDAVRWKYADIRDNAYSKSIHPLLLFMTIFTRLKPTCLDGKKGPDDICTHADLENTWINKLLQPNMDTFYYVIDHIFKTFDPSKDSSPAAFNRHIQEVCLNAQLTDETEPLYHELRSLPEPYNTIEFWKKAFQAMAEYRETVVEKTAFEEGKGYKAFVTEANLKDYQTFLDIVRNEQNIYQVLSETKGNDGKPLTEFLSKIRQNLMRGTSIFTDMSAICEILKKPGPQTGYVHTPYDDVNPSLVMLYTGAVHAWTDVMFFKDFMKTHDLINWYGDEVDYLKSMSDRACIPFASEDSLFEEIDLLELLRNHESKRSQSMVSSNKNEAPLVFHKKQPVPSTNNSFLLSQNQYRVFNNNPQNSFLGGKRKTTKRRNMKKRNTKKTTKRRK